MTSDELLEFAATSPISMPVFLPLRHSVATSHFSSFKAFAPLLLPISPSTPSFYASVVDKFRPRGA
jgi:hypothetical protein